MRPFGTLHAPSSPINDPPPQVGKAWLAAGRPDAAEWPYQCLRERLAALEALGAAGGQPRDVRRAAQLLQFHALQGSMVLAGNAGHQVCTCCACVSAPGFLAAQEGGPLLRLAVPCLERHPACIWAHKHPAPSMRAPLQALWSNLVARMQRLLDTCLLEPRHTAMLCQELADTLAAQAAASAAKPMPAAAGPGAAGGTVSAAAGGRGAASLLQCAEGLLAHCLQLVRGLAAGGGGGEGGWGGMDVDQEREDHSEWLAQLEAARLEVRPGSCSGIAERPAAMGDCLASSFGLISMLHLGESWPALEGAAPG